MARIHSAAAAILGIGLIAISLHSSTGNSSAEASSTPGTRVLVVSARALAAGTKVSQADIRTVSVADTPVWSGTLTDSTSVVGRYAAVSIPAGRVLDATVTTAAPIRSADVLVTVHVASALAPAALQSGDQVAVVDADGAGVAHVLTQAVIVRLDVSGASGDVVVTLDCSQDAALAISGAMLSAHPLDLLRSGQS